MFMNLQGSANPWTWLIDFRCGDVWCMCILQGQRVSWSSAHTPRGQCYPWETGWQCGSQRALWIQTRLGLDPGSSTIWLGNPGQVFFPLWSDIFSYGEGCAHLSGPWMSWGKGDAWPWLVRGEASPHETITVIVPPVSRGVDSICRLKKVVDTVDWVNLVGWGVVIREKMEGRKIKRGNLFLWPKLYKPVTYFLDDLKAFLP